MNEPSEIYKKNSEFSKLDYVNEMEKL